VSALYLPRVRRNLARVRCGWCGEVVLRRSTWAVRDERYCVRHFLGPRDRLAGLDRKENA
jgi:hypothetical protein